MARSPSAVAMRRLQSELTEWVTHPPEGCRLLTFEPLTTWVIEMTGPDSSPQGPPLYKGKVFQLRVRFTDKYPLEPPEFVYLSPTPVHPHIYSNGHICLDILYDSRNGGWSPALTVSKVALSLRSMLASNSDLRRPPGDLDYCARVGNRGPKETRWEFEDETV